MAGAAFDIGMGTTIAFSGSSFAANLLSVTVGGLSRASIDTSHMGTTTTQDTAKFGNMTFMPHDLTDAGEVTFTVQFDTTQAITKRPKLEQAAETVTITFPGGATWAGSGFFTGFSITDTRDDLVTMECVFKLSGAVTITQSV